MNLRWLTTLRYLMILYGNNTYTFVHSESLTRALRLSR